MGNAASAEERLAALTLGWAAADDRRAVFSECYLLMTRRVREAVSHGEFHDGEWVTRLLDRFADYYFDAVDAHGATGDDHVSTVHVSTDHAGVCPDVWRGALDACADPSCHPLQALMLGINAHINHDLALALVDVLDDWDTLDEAQRRQRHEDHELVNTIIDQTTDEVQREVVADWSPAASVLDVLLGPIDEWAFGELAQSWRSRVWTDAMDLVVLTPEGRVQVTARIGEHAAGVAAIIMLGRRPG